MGVWDRSHGSIMVFTSTCIAALAWLGGMQEVLKWQCKSTTG